MKRLLFLIIALSHLVIFQSYAQKTAKFPENWYNLELQKDSVFGIGTEKAYNELLKGRPSKKIIVAVIDAGTDVRHEDLKKIIWTNKAEIAGNGIDDDKNGYTDDIHGWNFIGGKDSNVSHDTYELTRQYVRLTPKYDGKDPKTISKQDKKEYELYKIIKADYEGQVAQMKGTYDAYKNIAASITSIKTHCGDDVNMACVESFKISSKWDSLAASNVKKVIKSGAKLEVMENSLNEGLKYFESVLNYHLNKTYNPRVLVGDNYDDFAQRFYGNATVYGTHDDHGTHVAGIVAAVRNNGIGVNGVADNVEIMVIRVVPDGDERDKDVANAIRYAADNGASIVNMSFGKSYSFNKKVVDDAVRYAASKDVLLVHAAGNDSKNTDEEGNFPNAKYEDSRETAPNWIEVGASTPYNDARLPAVFSNYGKKNVDLFAPGFEINSTTPNSTYKANNGTSMASPVVAGAAAVLRSYFPDLSAAQVKNILLESVTPVKYEVTIPGTAKKTKFSKLCKSGGVVNVYQAVQLATKQTLTAKK